MELREHGDLRDAGQRGLDHVDAYVEGRELEGLRESEADERTNHEAPEKDEREVLVESDVSHPDRVNHDPDEDQGERRRNAAEVLRSRKNGAGHLHVRKDEGDGAKKAYERRRENALHRFFREELRTLRMGRLDAVHGFEEVPHRPEIGRVREEVEKRRYDRFIAEQGDRNRKPDEHVVGGRKGRRKHPVMDALNTGDFGDEKRDREARPDGDEGHYERTREREEFVVREGLGDAREEIGGEREEGDELGDEALRAAVVPSAGGGDVTRPRKQNQNEDALDRVQKSVPHGSRSRQDIFTL